VTSPVSFGSPAPAAVPPAPALAHAAGLAHPLDGTGTGLVSPGTVGEFPGADVPFGMLQWSPDTSPDTVGSGGGYAYGDSSVNGFSLTHLSGTGCPSYQDIPILPTVGPLGDSPVTTSDTFSHAQERASPGRYSVELGPSPIGVTLADTTRTGIAGFDFPTGIQSNVLFKVADSANPATATGVHIVGDDTIEGQVTSGGFCGTGTSYTLHFAAWFNRPFAAAGTWTASGRTGQTSCTGTSCGAYATFDTTTQQHLLLKVGISFVSTANAAQNLAYEDPGWSLARVSAQAQAQWNGLLGRIAVRGGTAVQQHTFYTALYHSMLFPNVVSDVNGEYVGFDGRVHAARSGHEEYANFSEWDIYRSEVQLESLLVPGRVSDMVQSLVDDARQNGWLPRWAIVAGDTFQINGDSADPIIADAYAMGARDFDVKAALAAMVKGATHNETGHGLAIERQYLDQYMSQHYVNAGSLDLTSIDYSIGGSVTLEYAIDDFAIAQLAAAQHDTALAAEMMRRAASWEYLFNPATGYVQARGKDGSFPAGPAFNPSQFEPGGQTGFEEGNAVQYSWSEPQNLAALASLMGGDPAAAANLKTFFTALNAARYSPYDWSGNEPDEWAPWEFDYFGAPEQTQGTVRAIVDTEYADAPVDEPGNDDLGAISSWYVWGALGMFPVTPATANLALASPLFPHVTISLPDGRHLVEDAPGAASSKPYVHALTVAGVTKPASPGASCATRSTPSAHAAGTWDLPWLPASVLQTGGTLTYSVSETPDPAWGSAPADTPPSYGSGALPAVGFSSPSGAVTVTVGQPTAIQIGVAPAQADAPTVHWQVVSDPAGTSVTPSSGAFTLSPSTSSSSNTGPPAVCPTPHPQTQTLSVVASAPGSYALHVTLATDRGLALPPIVLDVAAQP